MEANKASEIYPIQFKDKLDEYLWKEHHILGDCCSSIESMKYAVAREVAEKLTDTLIEKAVLYLIYNTSVIHYSFGDIREFKNNNFDEILKDFKNYMKGE